MVSEDGHRAGVDSTRDGALRAKVQKLWELPDEGELAYTGKDWLLILLDSIREERKASLLMVL